MQNKYLTKPMYKHKKEGTVAKLLMVYLAPVNPFDMQGQSVTCGCLTRVLSVTHTRARAKLIILESYPLHTAVVGDFEKSMLLYN